MRGRTAPLLTPAINGFPHVPAGRQDEAEDAMRDVRGEVAEQRKQLKELLDAGGLIIQGRACSSFLRAVGPLLCAVLCALLWAERRCTAACL